MSTTALPDLSKLSPAEKARLLQQLQQLQADAETPEPPRKRTPLDTSEAVSVGPVIADLAADPRVKDDTFVGTTIWMVGHLGAKGPQGGVYFHGRVVVGTKEQARKGMMKIGAKHFRALQDGAQADAWVRFDGDSQDTLVGVMTNLRQPAPKRQRKPRAA